MNLAKKGEQKGKVKGWEGGSEGERGRLGKKKRK